MKKLNLWLIAGLLSIGASIVGIVALSKCVENSPQNLLDREISFFILGVILGIIQFLIITHKS